MTREPQTRAGSVPRRQEIRRRVPRLVLGLAVSLGTLLGLLALRTVLALGLAWWHYGHTPDFATFVREHPVSEAVESALWIENPVLSASVSSEPGFPGAADWLLGDMDPLALEDDDPDYWRSEVRFSATIEHGDERLLDLEQVLTAALVRGSGERHGLRLQTTRCLTAPGWHALTRIGIGADDELVGVRSSGRGVIHFEAALLAGAGDSRSQVVRGASFSASSFPEEADAASGPFSLLFRWGLLGRLHPGDPPPEEGLIYRLQGKVFLTQEQHGGGRRGIGYSPTRLAANSGQYSYRFATKTSHDQGGNSNGRALTYTWNGRIW